MAFAALGDGARAWELTAMINPLNHARTPEGVATYKVEPYVVAADVYALAPHTGRGGWTWYTGLCGLDVPPCRRVAAGSSRWKGIDFVSRRACLRQWNEFAVRYRYRETYYDIVVQRTEKVSDDDADAARVTVDGALQEGAFALLVDDQQEHRVDVHVASRRPVPQMSFA